MIKKIILIIILVVLVAIGLIYLNNEPLNKNDKSVTEEKGKVTLPDGDITAEELNIPEGYVEFIYNNELDNYQVESNIELTKNDFPQNYNDINKKQDNNVIDESEKTAYGEFDVEIYLDKNPGFGIMDIRCYYNPSVVEYTGMEGGEVHPRLDTEPVIQKDSHGTFVLLDFDYDGTDYKNTGKLAKVSFKVIDLQKVENSNVEIVFDAAANSKAEYVTDLSFDTKVVINNEE